VADDFQTRFRDALRRRLYPHAGLHLKQIAAAIGRSENTVARWWRGETRVLAEDLYGLAAFFFARGDREFLSEIFAEFVPATTLSDDMASSVLALIRSAFANADRGVALSRESCVWFTADGELAPASQGHAAYARNALHLPGVSGDVSAYAMRVLGWIAVTQRTDGWVSIRHDGRRVAPLAAERICDWLEDRADQVEQLRRSILMDGRWVDAYHANAHAAAAAIAKVAFIVRVPRRPWSVRPLPLDRVTDPRLGTLLQVYREQPRQLVRMAAAMGAFTTSSLFGVTGNDVVSHCVGTDLGFDPETVEGLNVLSRPDTEYALMLRARILATRRDGPVYNELCGTIDAYNVRYLNLALPEAGSSGRVLTSSVVLERELIAA
jgi:transcriptional regulator with XRE-family HTH domain